MQRASNATYRDENGNVLRIVQDENTITLAINNAETFALHTDDHDLAHAVGSELEAWSNQTLKVRHARWRAQRKD